VGPWLPFVCFIFCVSFKASRRSELLISETKWRLLDRLDLFSVARNQDAGLNPTVFLLLQPIDAVLYQLLP
jgi:hypothetical protein